MYLLFDADMPAHEVGHMRRNTGEVDENDKDITELVPFEEIEELAKGYFWSIIQHAKGGSFKAFITRGKHFRHAIATIKPYKGHREDTSRDNVDLIKALYHKVFKAEWCEDYEADDAMAMDQWADLMDLGKEFDWNETDMANNAHTCIVSRDKDLLTVPGWHRRWWTTRTSKNMEGKKITGEMFAVERGETFWVTWVQALRNFYKQMLEGDTADNIHGLYGVGPESKWIKDLDDMTDEQDMFEHVLDKYDKYYKNYARPFIQENGSLLHMMRYRGDNWCMPDERDDDYWNFIDYDTLVEKIMKFFRRLMK